MPRSISEELLPRESGMHEAAGTEATAAAGDGVPQPHGWGAGCARVWAVLVGIPAVVCITGVCGDAVSVLPVVELAFLALLQCSDGRTSATARGFGRWVGPNVVLHLKWLLGVTATLNTLLALRFLQGTQAVVSQQGESVVDNATRLAPVLDCGRQNNGLHFSTGLCANRGWASWLAHPTVFYVHIFPAMAMLTIGAYQMLAKRGTPRHVWLGRVYAACAVVGMSTVPVLSLHSTTGVLGWGFTTLACGVVFTTARGVRAIRSAEGTREQRVQEHKEWMIRSYSLIMAAITLRFWCAPFPPSVRPHALPSSVALICPCLSPSRPPPISPACLLALSHS